jgi:hypothetical protein
VTPVSTPNSLQVLSVCNPLVRLRKFIVQGRNIARLSHSTINGTLALALLLCCSGADPSSLSESIASTSDGDACLTIRRRPVLEAEKMTTAATILPDAGRLLWLCERVDCGDHDGYVSELGVDDSHGNAEHAGDCTNRMPITFSNLAAQSGLRRPLPDAWYAGEERLATRP